MTNLWNSAHSILCEARELVGRLNIEEFNTYHGNCYHGSIGGHIRHCAQHFESFKNGFHSRTIDYETRERGNLLESDPRQATLVISDLAAWFGEKMTEIEENGPIRIVIQDGEIIDSTIARELQFLVSHTIHHFAIINIMCHSLGVQVNSKFGVAPSTLAYQQENS